MLYKKSPGQSSKPPFAVKGERLIPPFSPTILDIQFRMGWIILWWCQSFSIDYKGILGNQFGHSYTLATPVSWDKSHPWMPLMSHKGCYACLSCESKPQMAVKFAKHARLIVLVCICVDVRSPDLVCYQHPSQWHQVIAAKATVCLGGNTLCHRPDKCFYH